MRGLRSLNLTDAQKAQIKTIVDSHQDDMKGIADRMIPARQALQAAIVANPVNESVIREAASAVGAVEADAAVLRARVHSEVWAS